MKTDHSSTSTVTTPATGQLATIHSRVIARSPIYYGWVILAAATFAMIMTTPGQTVGVSVFLDHIIAELNISRPVVSLMYTVGTLGGALSLPFVGRFIDARGPRRAVTLIAALFALACAFMGLVNGLVMLLMGFLVVRGLGQGALSLVSIHVINLWFIRRRGLAVGIAGVGMAVGTAVFPLLIEILIVQLGWRMAYMALGLLVALTILPLGTLLFRERPERFGLVPDGHADPKREAPPAEVTMTLQEARRTATFWLFSSASFMAAALGTALLFHHYSIMEWRGLDRLTAARAFVPLGFIMAAANLSTGALMDRVSPRYLLSFMLLMQSAILLMAMYITSSALVLLYGAVLGMSSGMSLAIAGAVYAHYFGRQHIGAIKGTATTIALAGTAFGPFIFAVGLDWFGGYAPVLVLTALPPLALALLAPFVKPPRARSTTAAEPI
jgi:MFS transporter, OFA family, oxalate/formate antiporter